MYYETVAGPGGGGGLTPQRLFCGGGGTCLFGDTDHPQGIFYLFFRHGIVSPSLDVGV